MYLKIFYREKSLFVHLNELKFFFFDLEWIHLGWNYLGHLLSHWELKIFFFFPLYSLKFIHFPNKLYGYYYI